MKILRLASSDDHDYDHSDYTEMMTDQYLIQLILKKMYEKEIPQLGTKSHGRKSK